MTRDNTPETSPEASPVDAAEQAEAARLADALAGRGEPLAPGSEADSPAQEAAEMAALVDATRGPGLTEDRQEAILASLLPPAPRRQPRSLRWLLPAGGFAAAAAAAALVVVLSGPGPAPDPTALPAAPGAVLLAQAEAAQGAPLTGLAAAMDDHRAASLEALERRYGSAP